MWLVLLLPLIACSGNESASAFELAFIPTHSQASLSCTELERSRC